MQSTMICTKLGCKNRICPHKSSHEYEDKCYTLCPEHSKAHCTMPKIVEITPEIDRKLRRAL